MRKIFAIALSAIVSCGLLVGESAAQNCSGQPGANKVCAGPSSGSAGFPAFRSLVAADLPAFGSGDVSFATGGGIGTIAANAVTYAKMQTETAKTILGNSSGGAVSPAEIGLGQGLNFLTTSKLQFEPAMARLWPASGQSATPTVPWQAVDPWGNPITVTPTNSQGFNEFAAATKAAGWSWGVFGNASLHTTVQLIVPPCYLRKEYIDTGVAFVVDSSLGASHTLVHDTYENCDIYFLGQVNQHAGDTGYCYAFAPSTTDVPGNIGGFATYLEVSSCSPASGGSGAKFDLTNGGMIGVNAVLRDMNGGSQMLLVTNPGTAFIAYEHNNWTFLYNHGATSKCGQIGTSNTNQANMRYNTYKGGRIEPGTGVGTCWSTWEVNATYENFNITNETANATIGFKFESGACSNTMLGGSILATTALSDGCVTAGAPNGYIGVKGVSPSYPGTATNDNASSGSIGEFASSRCPAQNATVTITIASPAVITYTAHGLTNTGGEADACPIVFTTSSALPTGITSGTSYWTVPSSLTANTFQIATSVINAIAGTAVNTSGSQSGTQTGTFNVGLVTATAKNLTGVALTAGDWDCTGNTLDQPAGSTVVTATNASIGTVTDALTSPWLNGAYTSSQYLLTGTARVTALSTGRFSLASTTNIYLVLNNSFSVSTEAAVGILRCRRVR